MKKIYKNPISDSSHNQIKDWGKALQTPFADMKPNMMHKLNSAASNWEICACGNLCSAIPRGEYSKMPLDRKLFVLGGHFADHVENMYEHLLRDFDDKYEQSRQEALEVHRKVELRAYKVLRDMGL